ncbi:hypothetical protein BGZ65_008042 [Modicella reniformis]|uniref:Uncharacterized protein n=1 Tax=Modicella reniformis TaxID=1440133 RepID=A0A9P6MEV2_9FUNG|nr:hypothetical protein BGZ65_008042 [Modicella reniformis]
MFATGKDVKEEQLLLLVRALVSRLVDNSNPVRVVAESLHPIKMLFEKESPNLYHEPLISMQLTQRSLEHILSRPSLSASVNNEIETFQDECIRQVAEVQQLIEKWRLSRAGQDHSPWGLSGRKPIFEALYHLISGSNLLKNRIADNSTTAPKDTSPDHCLGIAYNSSNIHPVIIESSQYTNKMHTGRLFLIE